MVLQSMRFFLNTYIEKIECKSLFTYFSYHKMLITFINCESRDEDEVINKIIEIPNDSMI